MAITEDAIDPARVGAEQFVVGPAVVPRPGARVAAADWGGVLVDVRARGVLEERTRRVARGRPGHAVALVGFGPAVDGPPAAGIDVHPVAGCGRRVGVLRQLVG